jgi:tripartite-type tricarboxylate transporter receptor subunit TctC
MLISVMDRFIVALLAGLFLLVTGSASAERSDFPTRPITLIVPFPADGPTDILAQDLSAALRRNLGGPPLRIDYVSGSSGTRGMALVAQSRPDGYTLLLSHIGQVVAPATFGRLPFDPIRDFTYLGIVVDVPMVLLGRTRLQTTTLSALQAQIKGAPWKFNIGHAGLGSASYLCAAKLQQQMGAELTTVPYPGANPAMQALLTDQIDLLCDLSIHALRPMRDRQIQAYAVSAPQRLEPELLRPVPTFKESGLEAMTMSVWYGLYAPRGLPEAVSQRLSTALRAALKDQEFVTHQQAAGARIVQDDRNTPEGHQRFVAEQTRFWAEFLRPQRSPAPGLPK